MIEAMACGTPVIAWRNGSVPEVIVDGVTGFIVDGIPEAVEAVHRLRSLNRRDCRNILEERFTTRRMAQNYVEVYLRSVRPGVNSRCD
jgi:glycosyltransferase involved in cell wall biosynthesis